MNLVLLRQVNVFHLSADKFDIIGFLVFFLLEQILTAVSSTHFPAEGPFSEVLKTSYVHRPLGCSFDSIRVKLQFGRFMPNFGIIN